MSYNSRTCWNSSSSSQRFSIGNRFVQSHSRILSQSLCSPHRSRSMIDSRVSAQEVRLEKVFLIPLASKLRLQMVIIEWIHGMMSGPPVSSIGLTALLVLTSAKVDMRADVCSPSLQHVMYPLRIGKRRESYTRPIRRRTVVGYDSIKRISS